VESKFCKAAHEGRIADVVSLLKETPDLDVNWANKKDDLFTALHLASYSGRFEVVNLLLAHPDINVNQKTFGGRTALSLACVNGRLAIARVLLKDPRVDAALADDLQRTVLLSTTLSTKGTVLEWLIASGRDLGDLNHKAVWENRNETALQIAERMSHKISSLLKSFGTNPEQTRYEVRVKLGALDELAAEVFALIVFLCDGVLQLKPALISSRPPGLRFFAIACKLPIELQMVLCHRVFESMKQSIVRNNSEIAFQSLARILRASHPE